MFASDFAAFRMRCDQDSIEVTREDVARAKQAARIIVRVQGLSSLATALATKNAMLKAESTESECEFPALEIDTEYMYPTQNIYGGGDALKSHLADAEEYNMVSIEADDVVSIAVDLGSGTREDDEDTIYIE